VNEQGAWVAPHTFARGGRYRLYADFTPPGSHQQVEFYDVTVQGPARPSAPSRATAAVPVTLEAGAKLRAGEDVELGFKLGSTEGLQPYLGAWAHIAIAGEGLAGFIHGHFPGRGSEPDS